MNLPRIITSPMGGCGSSPLRDLLIRRSGIPMMKRPDTLMGYAPSLETKPEPRHETPWKQRTGRELDLEKTWNLNLLGLLDGPENVLLCGLSSLDGFLSKNGISGAVLLVRHPLMSYPSFLGHQHPNVAKPYGGYGSEEAAAWYIQVWRRIVRDALEANALVIRYEHLPLDALAYSKGLYDCLDGGWHLGSWGTGKLSEERQEQLRSGLEDLVEEMYDSWELDG